jgi:hypothetical protein
MSGYRGTSPQMVEGDHEVDPAPARRLAYLSAFLLLFGSLMVIAWFGLGRFDPTATAYLSNHPGGLWALSALMFAGLWAYLAGQEYARRDEAVRTSTWRTARASRASGTTGDCGRCASVRAENAALTAELEVLKQATTEPVAEPVGTEPVGTEPVFGRFVVAGPGFVEPASAELPIADLPIGELPFVDLPLVELPNAEMPLTGSPIAGPVVEPMGVAPLAIGPLVELPDPSDEVYDMLALPADQDLREAT